MKKILLTVTAILILILSGCQYNANEKESELAKDLTDEADDAHNLKGAHYYYQKSDYTFDMAIVSIDGKEGIIDRNGNYVIELGKFSYTDGNRETFYHQTLNAFLWDLNGFIMIRQNDAVGFIDKKGNILVPLSADFDYVYAIDENFVKVSKLKGGHVYYGVVRLSDGAVIVPIKYQCIEKYPDGQKIIIASKNYDIFFGADEILHNNKFEDDGVIFDNDGKIISTYDMIAYPDLEEGLIIVYDNGKFGGVNEAGEVIIPMIYSRLSGFVDGIASFEKDGISGSIDAKGNVIHK